VDVSRGRAWATLSGHHEAVTAVAFSRRRQTAGDGGPRRHVRLWNAVTGREIAQLEVDRHRFGDVLRCVAFAPDGRTLARGAEDDVVHFWTWSTAATCPPSRAAAAAWPRRLHARRPLAAGRRRRRPGAPLRPPPPRPRALRDDPIRKPLAGGGSRRGRPARSAA